jgi:hypothetical protein
MQLVTQMNRGQGETLECLQESSCGRSSRDVRRAILVQSAQNGLFSCQTLAHNGL